MRYYTHVIATNYRTDHTCPTFSFFSLLNTVNACVIPVDYRTDDKCVTVHVRHATTDRILRALPTRGHARPRVHRAGRPIHDLRACQSLYYRSHLRFSYSCKKVSNGKKGQFSNLGYVSESDNRDYTTSSSPLSYLLKASFDSVRLIAAP